MKVAIVGAGLIGHTIAHMLRETGDYDVVAFDRDQHALDKLAAQGIPTRRVDSADAAALRAAIQGFDALINALPYYLAVNVASAAKGAGVHYFDLTEDVRATQRDPRDRRRRRSRLHAAVRSGAGLHRHRRA